MRVSKFSEKQKIDILKEKEDQNMTIASLCKKYDISVATYYLWKRKANSENMYREILSVNNRELSIRDENITLRKLYINLSEHNYQLAKFLNNQAQ